MFEKDAEEYAIGLTYPKFQDSQIANIVLRDVEGGFQKGAEFGYNKAKVEVEDSYRESLCNSELNLTSVTEQLEELEKENVELKERYNKVDIIGYDALKNLTKAENIIRELLFHLTNDTFYVTFETREQSVERARQFLQRR